MMDELPAYSGPLATCPKCKAGTNVLTIYHRSWDPCEYRPSGEHLCRVCKNCSYGWVEACADGGTDQRPDLTLVQDIDEPGVGPGVNHARRHEP